MTAFFIHIYRFFSKHKIICWGSMVAAFLFFGYFAAQIHLEEDINKLMPSSKNEDGTTKLAFADLKIKDKVFLLFEGEGIDNLTEACDAFVDTLLCDTALVEDVFYRLDDELMPDGIDYLSAHLPAYIDTTAYADFDTLLTRQHMMRQMEQNRKDFDGEFGSAYPELIQLDPIGMREVLMRQLSPLLKGGTGSYVTVDNHFFVPDSTVCIAFITPRYSSTNTGDGSALFKSINKLIAQFAVSHPDVHVCYHGTPASGYYNSTQIKHDLTTTIAGALLLVLLFLLVCFRRCDTIPLLLLPVAFGTIFGLAMMYWIKGEFSLLALGIGGVVLGVALSYVLHILTHHKYVSDGEALLREQVKPVLMGCITTIGSFSALIFVETDLLSDFGLFASFAIMATTLFSLIYLPQMMRSEKPSAKAGKADGDGRPFPNWLRMLCEYPFDRKKSLLAVIGLVTIVCVTAYIVGGTHFDADMHNLGYDEKEVKYSEDLLRSKTFTGDKTKYFASQGSTMEEALENFACLGNKLDSLRKLGLVKQFTPTGSIFLTKREQQRRIEAWKGYWNGQRLQQVRRLIAETAPAAGLRPEAFEPFFEAATAEYDPDALYEAGIIPQGFLSTLMERSYDGTYLCFTSVRCANDSIRSSESDYMRICDAIAKEPKLMVLDTYYYTTDTLIAMSRDFDRLQWISMAFVMMVLLAAFRMNFKHALLTFMPILLSWLIVLGAMNLCGQQFNLISIIISTFIFGIGVDYSIFVMQGIVGGQLHSHKMAILLSAITLMVTVGSMMLAVHPAIRSVGFSTLVGLLAAIVLAYVLQPAAYRWLHRQR